MEERFNQLNYSDIHKIVICGPESTGKTSLASYLAEHYQTVWVPEYARTYISDLKRAYNYNDLVQIAEKQVFELKSLPKNANKFIFYDTGLIITKIWFKEVYNKYPIWLDDVIEINKPALYLLCYYDLPWQFDILRENGSLERRAYLYNLYKAEIEKIGCKYSVIKGINQDRLNLAIQIVDQFNKDNVRK
jgi:nicotinamide riboside kinase